MIHQSEMSEFPSDIIQVHQDNDVQQHFAPDYLVCMSRLLPDEYSELRPGPLKAMARFVIDTDAETFVEHGANPLMFIERTNRKDRCRDPHFVVACKKTMKAKPPQLILEGTDMEIRFRRGGHTLDIEMTARTAYTMAMNLGRIFACNRSGEQVPSGALLALVDSRKRDTLVIRGHHGPNDDETVTPLKAGWNMFWGARKPCNNEVMKCSGEDINFMSQFPMVSLLRMKGIERNIEVHVHLPLLMLQQMQGDLMSVLKKIDINTTTTTSTERNDPISCEWPAYLGSESDDDSYRRQFRIIIVEPSVFVNRQHVLDAHGKQIAECDFDETTVPMSVMTNTTEPLTSTEVFIAVQNPASQPQNHTANKQQLRMDRSCFLEAMRTINEVSLMRLWDTEFYANARKFCRTNTGALEIWVRDAVDMGLLPNLRMLEPFVASMSALASDDIPMMKEAISFLEDVLTPHDSSVNRIAIHCLQIAPQLLILDRTLRSLAKYCEDGDVKDVVQCIRRVTALMQRLLDANGNQMRHHLLKASKEIKEVMDIGWLPQPIPIVDWREASEDNLSRRGLFRERRKSTGLSCFPPFANCANRLLRSPRRQQQSEATDNVADDDERELPLALVRISGYGGRYLYASIFQMMHTLNSVHGIEWSRVFRHTEFMMVTPNNPDGSGGRWDIVLPLRHDCPPHIILKTFSRKKV